MENGYSHSPRLAAFLYKLEMIQRLQAMAPNFRREKRLYSMFVLDEGEGVVYVNGSRYSLAPRKVFIVVPDSECKLGVQAERPPVGFFVQFQVLQAGPNGHYAPAQARFPQEVAAARFPLIRDKLREAEQKLNSGNQWDVLEANIRFQEVICDLFRDGADERPFDLKQAVQLARDYIEQHYRSPITRELLAEMAGLNADYFSRAFKRHFGKSPIAYVNDVRINQAKRLLLQSGEPLRTVAKNVGFSDEFYFSRKFKALTGSSPAAYVKNMKDSCKLASLNHLITGHLIALGLEPYAAIISKAFPVFGPSHHTINLGQTHPDLEKLVQAKPDLIVTRGTRDGEKSPKEKIYEQIAPTISLDYRESWRSHFWTIARIVGRDKEAETWLARYDRKAELMRKQIKSRTGEETFLILGIGADRFVVYGQRNIGTVLYGDLQLAAPEAVRQIAHYQEVELADLLSYDADRIVLTVFRNPGAPPSDQAIRKQLRKLSTSGQWQSLKAVRSGKVYGLYDGRYLYTSYNPLTHNLLLDKLQQLLLAD
ncbi:helix-turn-helix domain-containing protein [Brevibacillus marinus]|uniref:helix-turn-helix domain-containing protein n=1 Tax=Brevibacillus marinus TaxID=2496837 RepID=UPI000F81AFC6|nr:helix-turn-helix domain-containing protein [Brevibacillus marinus]